jgi:hypothetical protein
MARGVGAILIRQIMQMAKLNNVVLEAEWLATDVNRMMYMTYKFAHFYEDRKEGEITILRNDLKTIDPFPDYVVVNLGPGLEAN